MTQPAFGQRIHAMRRLAGFEHIGNQHRIVEAAHNHTVAFHQQVIVFEVLRDLEDSLVLKQVLQTLQSFGKGHLPFGELDAITEEIAT